MLQTFLLIHSSEERCSLKLEMQASKKASKSKPQKSPTRKALKPPSKPTPHTTPPPSACYTAPAIYEADLSALEAAIDNGRGGLTTAQFLERLFAQFLEDFPSDPSAAAEAIDEITAEFLHLYNTAMDYRLILSEIWTLPMAPGVCNYKQNVERVRALENDLASLTDDLEMAQGYISQSPRRFKEHFLDRRSFIYQELQ